jgi:hypothetical protein
MLNFSNHLVRDCRDLPRQGISEIYLSDNPITSFVGFPPINCLVKLSLDRTLIQDFRGFPRLPNLKSISMKGTPVMKHPQARIALIMLVGPNLRSINEERVARTERQLASIFSDECPGAIRAGWMPTIPPPTAEQWKKILQDLAERTVSHRKEKHINVSDIPQAFKPISVALNTKLSSQTVRIQQLSQEISELSQMS